MNSTRLSSYGQSITLSIPSSSKLHNNLDIDPSPRSQLSSHHERVSNVYLENSRHETRERREIISMRREIREMDTDRSPAERNPRLRVPSSHYTGRVRSRSRRRRYRGRHDEEAAVVKDSLDRERKSSAVIGITELLPAPSFLGEEEGRA